jgi:hypothetical protein
MTAYQQIQKDFLRLSSFTRSKSQAILKDPALILLTREYQSSPSPATQKKLLDELKGAYSENAEHLRKMVQRSGSLGRFHSVWLAKELPLSTAQQVLNADMQPRSKKFSRLFNEPRMQASINKQSRMTLALLDSGQSMESIAKGARGMNNDSERIWRTESHQMYNNSVKVSMKDTGLRLQAIEVLDDRTREQSFYVNETISDQEGRFLYPDGGMYVLGQSGQAQWDINDRGIAVPYAGADIRTLEVGEDIPPPPSLAVELAKNIAISVAVKELFKIVWGVGE